MRKAISRTSAASVLWLLVVACAAASAPVVPASGPPLPTVSPNADVWVAVLGVDEAPSALSSDRDAVLEVLGDALEGAVVVSPASCLDGLPAEWAGDRYVLAIQQGSRAEVRVLAAQLPQRPRFIGQVHLLCTD